MNKYDDKLVDELLSQLEGYEASLTHGAIEAIKSLKPKPAKFYVLPEWEEFCKGKTIDSYCQRVLGCGFNGEYITVKQYNAIREATATDKPMVRIPKGSEWSPDDLSALAAILTENYSYSPRWQGWRAVIDAIKAKLEPKL
jgi:hypothetical protein